MVSTAGDEGEMMDATFIHYMNIEHFLVVFVTTSFLYTTTQAYARDKSLVQTLPIDRTGQRDRNEMSTPCKIRVEHTLSGLITNRDGVQAMRQVPRA